MEEIVKIVTELGSFGLLLALSGFIIYSYIKHGISTLPAKNVKNSENNLNKDDIKEIVDEGTKEIKSTIKEQSEKIDELNTRIDKVEEKYNKTGIHTKQFSDRLKLGPQLHKILNTYRNRINADHIFIGSFHNGNESLSGIPYYKFDIIAERFRPDKVEQDIEFAPNYKDVELLRHDNLPIEVIQRNTVKYVIDENGNSELKDIDDIIYRRMIGSNIKQLAITLLRDSSGTPSGFVGGIKYDYEDIDTEELRICGDELEQIYTVNDKLISKK